MNTYTNSIIAAFPGPRRSLRPRTSLLNIRKDQKIKKQITKKNKNIEKPKTNTKDQKNKIILVLLLALAVVLLLLLRC